MTSTIRVLHLEDDPLDAELIHAGLIDGGCNCHVRRVETRVEYEQALDGDQYDLILSDYNLPSLDGLSAMTLARARHPDTPFVFVSGTMGEDAAIQSLLTGATDYVLKHKPSRLVPAVRRALLEAENQLARRRAEEQLRTSESCYRGLFEAAGHGILIVAASTGTILDANRVATAMLDRPRAELVGKTISDLQPRLGGDAARAVLARLARPELGRRENVVFDAGGGGATHVEIETSAYPVGRETLVQVNMRDITERKRAEEDLREERDLVTAITETIPVGVARTDAQGRIAFVNTEAEAILGRGRDEIIGRTLDAPEWRISDFRGNPVPREEMPFEKVMRSHEPASAELALQRPDGARVLLRVKGAPLRDAQGAVAGVVLALEDMTERRRMESQLLQAQKMEAVGQLAGGVAHDFNNLLTAILSCCEMLLEGVPQALREEVVDIRAAARRAAALTRQLLTFSRRQIARPQVLDVNEIVAGMDRMLRRLIGEDVELVANCGSGLGRIRADPGQVEQVIVNLALNARDATPGGGRIAIETANAELGEEQAGWHVGAPPGRYVMLSVRDTGAGMDAETLSHLFEPFFTTKEPGKGTGLGLPTIYGVVKQAGGAICVESEGGRGTVFRVYFPRTEDAPQLVDRVERGPVEHRGTETVLLVEDDPSVRSAVARTLRAAGFTVLVASDGEEGLRVAEAAGDKTIDVLVADVVMPRIGGEDLARRMEGQRPGMRVLLVSGYPERRGIQLPPEDGWRILQKPYAPGALAREIRELIDGRGAGGRLPRR